MTDMTLQEREVSKAADDILFEVRRKISDVKKSLKTLVAVQKLREVRVSKKSGGLDDDVFVIIVVIIVIIIIINYGFSK